MKLFYFLALTYLATLGFVMDNQPVQEYTPTPLSPYLVCERDTYASNVHCLSNEHRKSLGLPLLTHSAKAEKVAKKRAIHLCDTNTFTHDGWNDFFDYSYKRAGENLSIGYKTPQAATQGLLNSEGHRLNIEGDWDSMGVYTVECEGRSITAQIFTKG